MVYTLTSYPRTQLSNFHDTFLAKLSCRNTVPLFPCWHCSPKAQRIQGHPHPQPHYTGPGVWALLRDWSLQRKTTMTRTKARGCFPRLHVREFHSDTGAGILFLPKGQSYSLIQSHLLASYLCFIIISCLNRRQMAAIVLGWGFFHFSP